MSDKTDHVQISENRRFLSRIGLGLLFVLLFLIQKFVVTNPLFHEVAGAFPFVYLGLILFDISQGKIPRPLESWFAVNASWFLAITHKVYILPSLIMFGFILWRIRQTIWAAWSLLLYCLLCLATILSGTTT